MAEMLSRRSFLAQSAYLGWLLLHPAPAVARGVPRSPRPPARNYAGIGLWGAHQPAAARTHAANAIEVGTWWIMNPAGPGWKAYPNAAIRSTYKIAIEIKDDAIDRSQFQWDQSASFIPFKHCNPDWICKKDGQLLHSYNGEDWLGNLGHPGYQQACVKAALGMCRRYGVKALYIDNMHGAVSMNSLNGVIPDGYASDDDWRARAAIPWLMAVGSALHDVGVYVYANCGDRPLAGSQENYDRGDCAYRYWGQIRGAEVASGKVAIHGLFNEFFMQRPPDNNPYSSGGQTWDANAPGWQRLVARAQQLGKDFHGLVYSNGGSAERYARGCFLLDADLQNRRSTLWTCSLEDPKMALHPGVPVGRRQKLGAVDARRFENYTVYVNMTTSAQTANGVSVPPLDSVFVPTST